MKGEGGMENVIRVILKASGDVTGTEGFLNDAMEKMDDNYGMIICGAGKQINETLKKAGLEPKFDHRGNRITDTARKWRIARNVLEREAEKLRNRLAQRGIFVVPPSLHVGFAGRGVIVIPSFVNDGSVIIPKNGDDLLKTLEKYFDEKYVYTTEDRIQAKRIIFKDHPAIKVIGITATNSSS
jgi:hypothetical protein